MKTEQPTMNRAQRRSARLFRRKKTITGLAFLATASVVAGYGQFIRGSGAYATGITCTVNTNTDLAGDATNRTLRYCVTTVQANTGAGGSIDFSGVTTITLTSAMPNLTEDMTLDGGAGVTISGGSGFGFLKVDATGVDLTLKDLTIQNFTSMPSTGGIVYSYNKGGSLSIIDSTISNNSGTYIVYAHGGDPTVTVTNSTFTGNDGSNEGGAINATYSLTVTGSTFTNNHSASPGGAVFIDGIGTITDSTFTGNSADDNGGALYKGGSSYGLTITGSTFADNDSTDYGGAAYVYEVSQFTATDSTFSGNSGTYGGALYFESGGSASFVNSRIFDNTATARGGGIYVGDLNTSVNVTSSSIVQNDALSGGAIFHDDSVPLTITNSYLADNVASGSGSIKGSGAVKSSGALSLIFSTLSGNSTTTGSDIELAANLTVKGSVISTTSTGGACAVTGTVTDEYAVATDTSCGLTGSGSVQSATSPQLALGTASTQVVNAVTQSFQAPGSSSILVTGAPSTNLGTTVTNDQVGTARSGTYTIGSIQVGGSPPPPPPPAPSGGGGGASETPSASVSASPSASASASSSVAPSAPARLESVLPGSVPGLPPGGLPAGGSLLLVNGVPVPLTVSPNAQRDPVALVFSGPGLNMRLEGRGDENDPLGLTSKQALILQSESAAGATTSGSVVSESAASADAVVSGRSGVVSKVRVKPTARTSGDGFAPGTPVRLFLLTVGYLGEVGTDAAGSFAGAVPVPPGIRPGVYTLQANGFAPDFSVRSLSIGVLVKPTSVVTRTARASVFFGVLSPELDARAKASLRSVAAKVRSGDGAVRSVVVGYVQPTGGSANDGALSAARARAVAAYLRTLGVKGVYVVRGDGRASESGAQARRVNVAITYRA